MFGLPTKAIVIGVLVLSILAGLGLIARTIYKSGVDSERRAQVQHSLDRNATRNEDDEQLRNLDLDGLCREYGAKRWVPERSGCE